MTATRSTAEGKRGGTNGSPRRAHLLEIAAELFATRGYAQTTVRDIADEAGLLSGSLYHHFASKEAMLTEILQGFMGDLLGGCTRIVEQGDKPSEMLDGLIRHSFETIHRKPSEVALYQNESALLAGVPGFEFVTETSLEIEKIWLDVLEAGRASGVFRKDVDVKLLHRFIRDAVWASVSWYRPGGRFNHVTLADQFIELLHGGVYC